MDDPTCVLNIIPPMGLHFHLEVVNKLYNQLYVVLIENKSTKTAKDWSDKVESIDQNIMVVSSTVTSALVY